LPHMLSASNVRGRRWVKLAEQLILRNASMVTPTGMARRMIGKCNGNVLGQGGEPVCIYLSWTLGEWFLDDSTRVCCQSQAAHDMCSKTWHLLAILATSGKVWPRPKQRNIRDDQAARKEILMATLMATKMMIRQAFLNGNFGEPRFDDSH